MPRSCAVCAHPSRASVDERLRAGGPPRALARLYPGLTRLHITRHRDGCEMAGEKPGDLAALFGAVRGHSTGAGSVLHGEAHWRRVAVAGSRLSDGTAGADPLVVLLFALLHDSMRIQDGEDPGHGHRAARLAEDLLGGGPLLSPDQLETLVYALEQHDAGGTSGDPTIGACWDADRLDLWRVGLEPDPALLSTAAAREPGTIEWAYGLQGERFTWKEIMRREETF